MPNHGRAKAPGHISSPGVKHSSEAEVSAYKLKEIIFHSNPHSFSRLIPTKLVGMLVL